MNKSSTSRLLALTVAMAMGFAVAGSAEDAPVDGQTAEPPPVPDKGTTSQLNCIDQRTEYKQTGKSLFYIQTFANKCEARMKCTIFVYQLNARGPSQGRGTLILGAKSAGDAAKKSYALKIKGAGGFSTSERECRCFDARKARQHFCRRAGGRVHPNPPRCLPSRRLYG